MRRAYTCLVASLLTGLAAMLTVGSALAGYSRVGCLGALGNQYIQFDGNRLLIIGGSGNPGEPREAKSDKAKSREAMSPSILDVAAAARQRGFIQFNRDKSDGQRAMVFSGIDDNKQTQKVVLTEKSSQPVSHRTLRFCGRSTITDLYRNIYRYKRGSVPAHDITVMCMDYECTTDGGRDCSGERGFVDC